MPALIFTPHNAHANLPAFRRALVVDDEEQVLITIALWLRAIGWECVCARTVCEALRASADPCLSLALVDYRLDIGDEGIRLGRALRLRRGLPFALVSGYLCPKVVVEAMKAGAFDVLEKPLSESGVRELLDKVSKMSDLTMPPDSLGHNAISDDLRSVCSSWARMILKACDSRRDPRTVAIWGEAVARSSSSIDETCRLCGVKAKDSRDVARFLRAMAISRRTGATLRSYFEVDDHRTMLGLFERAGVPYNARSVMPQEFFRHQTFIVGSPPCLKELVHLVANSPLFF